MGRHHKRPWPPDVNRYRRAGEFERELIRTRTGEGRARAKARGVKLGRPPKMTPHQIKEALRRRDTGEPMRDIARSDNVSYSTISRLRP
jgi:DNA invertase Pin-like site-specific DNA recombinase